MTVLGLTAIFYPIVYNQFLAGFSRNVFSLPFPDETTVTFMMIFGIMAIGLNIVAGFAGLLDLGYVAFYAIGAYTAAFFASPALREREHRPIRERRPGLPGHPPAVLDHHPARRRHRRDVRRAPGRPDPALAW